MIIVVNKVVNNAATLRMMVAVPMVIYCILTMLNIFLQSGNLYLHIKEDQPTLDQLKDYFELVIAPAGKKAIMTPPFLGFIQQSKLIYSYVG